MNRGGLFDAILGGVDENWWGLGKGGQKQSFDTGTDGVSRTGLALVHQGERIVNGSGASSGVTSSMMGGGRGDTHIYMPPGLIIGTTEEAAREVARSAGRGVGSPL